MHDLEEELRRQLIPIIAAGDLDGAERLVTDRLTLLPSSPFHVVLELHITNSPVEVAEHFDNFFEQESARFRIAAAYAEMNDFNINPEAWFFDVFAYQRYDDSSNANHWLADWQSEIYSPMLLTGLESLQEVYASDAWHDKPLARATGDSNGRHRGDA